MAINTPQPNGAQPNGVPAGGLVRREDTVPVFYDQPTVGPFGAYDGAQPPHGVRPWNLERILRFKWTIVAVSVLLAAPAVAAIWTLTVPQYTAKAEVRVRPIIPRLVFSTEDNGMIPLYQNFMNTQVSIIRNPTVLGRVLDQPDVQNTAWYKESDASAPLAFLTTPATRMERLRADLSVMPRGQTEIIDVSLTGLSPNDTAIIVNAVLDQYIRYTREKADETSDLVYKKLTEEVDSLRGEVEGREKVVGRLSKELGTASPDELVSQMRVRLDQAEARLAGLRQEIATLEWQEKDLAALLEKITQEAAAEASADPEAWDEDPTASAVVPPAEQQPKYETDEIWRRFYFDVLSTKSLIEVEGQRVQEPHPKMIELRKRLKFAEDLLRERKDQLDAQWRTRPRLPTPAPMVTAATAGPVQAVNPQITTEADARRELRSVRQRLRLLKYQEQLSAEDVKTQRANVDRTFESAQLLTKENEAIRHKRELHGAVRTRLDQKEMERNVPGAIDVLMRASPPSAPSGDRRILLTALALAGALGAGVALAFFRASTSQAVHEPDDVASAARTPFLGQLPLVSRKQCPNLEDSEVLGECIRMVRTALLRRLTDHRGGVVQVTSAGPSAGKSTLAVMLAKSLAQCGKKVLLVDGDLRNPSISGRFGISCEPGFLSCLGGESPDTQAIVETDTPHLSVLPAGNRRNGTDTELMANGAFAACLNRWREHYDVVLMDSSPLLPVADGRIMAQHADGSIVVVREGNCRRGDVREALECLEASGGTLLGVVFIGSGRRSGYRSSYYYQQSASETSNGSGEQTEPTGSA
jgi:capsular exopolysaccharide synthesis family protein